MGVGAGPARDHLMPQANTGSGQRPPTVVLDLDGTLVDSARDICNALNHALALAGRREFDPDEARGFIHVGIDHTVEHALKLTGGLPPAAETDEFRRIARAYYDANLVVHTRPYAGVVEVLNELAAARYVMAICTNKLESRAREVLVRLDLARFFRAVVGRDSLPYKKPDPMPLRAAIHNAGGGAGGAVFVGDSAVDVATARAAGIPVIAVEYGYSEVPAADLGADALISQFSELPPIVARFLASGADRRA
jgi:phosphoglycolate phosphatase